MGAALQVGVVIATRDRRGPLLKTLERLGALPERPAIVVVDNGSRDGTPAAVRAAFPAVTVLEPGRNLGAAARTLGARALAAPLIAFCDDDSWWAPGALARTAGLFGACPRLGLVAARVLVGEDLRLDPTCATMARSPLPGAGAGAPGPGVLGFVACGAIVRRDAFLHVGGFDERYGIGGEERPLAVDLAAAGWELAYAPDVVAHHHPAATGARRPERVRRQLRNDLWSAWLRRPVASALRESVGLLARCAHRHPRDALAGAAAALGGTPWVVRERRVIPAGVERALRAIESVG
jgi:GT2 family glycosyltransferase